MKKVFFVAVLFISANCFSQVFIGKGMVEYEVRVNNHKTMGEGMWADMMRDKTPKFSTSYYNLIFNNDKSIYLFNRKDPAARVPWGSDVEEDVWYHDYAHDNFVNQKTIFGESYLLADSLADIKWKITNENREIAGFNCRKAVAVLFDSVYVFAFYTDEITVTGGPMGLHGLPGLILGVTIPRMFTSWVATKIEVNGVDDKKIVAPKKGKTKKAGDLAETILKATKDWGSYGQQAVWNALL